MAADAHTSAKRVIAPVPPADVLSVRHRLKVAGVHAAAVPAGVATNTPLVIRVAPVVELVPGRDSPLRCFVRNRVSQSAAELSIAVTIN